MKRDGTSKGSDPVQLMVHNRSNRNYGSLSAIGCTLLLLSAVNACKGAVTVDGIGPDNGIPPFATIDAALRYAANHGERLVEVSASTLSEATIAAPLSLEFPDGFTLRAAPGKHPVITVKNSFWFATAKTVRPGNRLNEFIIEGLDFIFLSYFGMRPDGTVTARGCSFITKTAYGAWYNQSAAPNSGTFKLEDCYLESEGGGYAFYVNQTQHSILRRCKLVAHAGGPNDARGCVNLRSVSPDGKIPYDNMSCDLEECVLVAVPDGTKPVPHLIMPFCRDYLPRGSAGGAGLRFSATNCLFLGSASGDGIGGYRTQNWVGGSTPGGIRAVFHHCTWRPGPNASKVGMLSIFGVGLDHRIDISNCLFDCGARPDIVGVYRRDPSSGKFTGGGNMYNLKEENMYAGARPFDSPRYIIDAPSFVTDQTGHLRDRMSPAIGKAIPLSPAVEIDVDGQRRHSRGNGTGNDIGAAEFHPRERHAR